MHTIELLECALAEARKLGYEVRQEWLGGSTGGVCQVGHRRYLFVDLALNPIEQLEQVTASLKEDPAIYRQSLPAELRQQLGMRSAA